MNAFAMWKGEGYLVQTGPKQGTFAGTLVGNMYILTDKGPQLFGGMVCPASIDIGLEDKSQTGRGRCVITSKDDAYIFAEISCTGFHQVGCDGDFKITGGSGRFGGITGGGRVMFRMDSQPTVAGLQGGVAAEQGTGTISGLAAARGCTAASRRPEAAYPGRLPPSSARNLSTDLIQGTLPTAGIHA